MTYKQAREYIKFLDKRGSVLGLSNMERLMNALGHEYEKSKIIHIAGTNGKGSVGAFLEHILTDNGFTVGRYISPAIQTYLERFTINSKEISEEAFADCIAKIKSVSERENIEPTAFEVETSVALICLAQCDYILLEVGLGGREDATNVIKTSNCSVITSISNDHGAILGDTLSEIAYQKAGIIKPNGTVICAHQCDEVANTIINECRKLNASLSFADKPTNIRLAGNSLYFDYKEYRDIKINTLGQFQPENAALSIEVAKNLGIMNFRNSLENTRWRGRFEVISKEPLIIIDGAHNEDAAIRLKESLLTYYPDGKFRFITGVLADKNYDKIMSITAPLADEIYTITPNNPRALKADKLSECIKKYNKNVIVSTLESALSCCISDKGHINIIFGSLSFLGDAIRITNELVSSERI